MPIRRALLSVSDKAGLVDFSRSLVDHGVELLSTGGTAKAIRDAGIPVKDVSEFTNSPEIMDGRVKTLHPRVHGGILMRDTASDIAQLSDIGGAPIDLVVVNLYPFGATVAKGAPFDECIENIDIGGPTMVRAAAKNHARVSVVVEPADYAAVVATLESGGPPQEMRAKLAMKVSNFQRRGSMLFDSMHARPRSSRSPAICSFHAGLPRFGHSASTRSPSGVSQLSQLLDLRTSCTSARCPLRRRSRTLQLTTLRSPSGCRRSLEVEGPELRHSSMAATRNRSQPACEAY